MFGSKCKQKRSVFTYFHPEQNCYECLLLTKYGMEKQTNKILGTEP